VISSIEPLPIDEAAIAALAEQHRRELHLHCYGLGLAAVVAALLISVAMVGRRPRPPVAVPEASG
jgi:hypothetical protein